MRRRTLLGLVGLLLAGLLASQATGAGAQAGGADPPYLADATDPAVTTLASDLGISIREAQRRVGWQEPAMQLGEELRQALGDRFGGLWFDEAGGGRVKVGVVGSDAAGAGPLIAGRKLTAVTDLVAVRYSYAELEQAHAWLSGAIINANPPTGKGEITGLASALLVDKNKVELQLPRGQSLNAAQQAAVSAAKRRLGTMLTLDSWSGKAETETCEWDVSLPTWDCDPPLRGGVGMVRGISGGIVTCSTGFNVRSNSDNKWYVMTAGHCGAIGTVWNAYPPDYCRANNCWALDIGPMHNAVDSGYDDFGIVANSSNLSVWRPGPYVYVHLSPDTTKNALYPIEGVGSSSVGMRVCVSGGESGTDCGAVKAVNWPVAGGYAVVDYCTTYGDSGSPVYSGNLARGIHIGSKLGATACHDRLYQGVAEAAKKLNVYVVHS